MASRSILAVLAALALAGCTLGPDYTRPGIDLPDSKLASTRLSTPQEQALASWWTRFEDPVLNNLIDSALDRNLRIAKQAQKVLQARAELGMANAELFPSVSAQAQAARQERSVVAAQAIGSSSGSSSAGGAAGGGSMSGGSTSGAAGGSSAGSATNERRYNTFSVAGSLNYELDIFGRLRRMRQAAWAQLLSSAYSQDSIRLTVVADVVTNYMTLRSLQRQVRVTQDTIDTRMKGLSLDKKRYQYGAINKLTLLQTRTLLQSARAQLPPLQQQLASTRTALAILTGKTPRQIMQRSQVAAGNFDDVHIPDLPAVIPSLIVGRRPDIRAAEANLIAANANVGAAKARFFPTFNISAMLGTEALNVDDLFDPLATASSITGSIAQPILDFGRRNANYISAQARKRQARIAYRQTLRQAFKEVSDALTEIKYTRQRLIDVRQQLDAYQQTLDLARTRYRAGQTNFFNVLDAQRNVFSTQLNLASAIRDRFTATADLFKAVGGGWTTGSDSLTPAMQAIQNRYDARQNLGPAEDDSTAEP